MNNEIFDRLRPFIAEQAAVENEEVTRETRIEEDLGIYGNDATDLLIRYGKTFNVDVMNFMSADYFTPEGDMILPSVINFFTNRERKKIKILTVLHLEKGIIAGRLDDDIING